MQAVHIELIKKLAAAGHTRKFRKGTILMHEGELGASLCVVITGKVRVFLASESGKELTLGVHGPGEFVGELSLDGGPRSASVEAFEGCQCSIVPLEAVKAFLRNEPDFSWLLLNRLIQRVRATTETSRSVALMDVYGRLKSLFSSMGEKAPDGQIVLPPNFTQLEISKHLACSREMISKLLRDLETGGYIRASRAKITLVKPLPERW